VAISVGSVEVDVVPNTRGIYQALRRAMVPAATRAGEDAGSAAGRSFGPAMQSSVAGAGERIGQQLGREIATRITAEIRGSLQDGVTQGGRAARPAASREGSQVGGAFARAARARIEAAFRSLPDITIGADTSEADSDLQALRARMQALSSRTIGVDLDAGEARAELQALENQLRRVGASHPNPTVRADTASARAELSALRLQLERMEADPTRIRVETDGTFGQRLRAQVQAAEASLPNINISASTTQAEAEIASLRARLTSLRDVRIGVDMDAATANAQISDIQARLTALSASDAGIAVRVDAGAAATQLAAVQGMVSALDGQTARIDVDTSGATAAIFQLTVAIAGVAVIPAIPVLAAGLGSITAAATAAGAGIGAFGVAAIPAIKDIAGALQAQKAAQDAATRSTSQGGATSAQAARQALQQAGAQQALAAAHRNGARQIGQAQQSVTAAHRDGAQRVAAAEQAVGDAVRRAAEANRSAAEQVKSARQGLSSAYEQAADRMRSANERVVSAEQSLADAQRTARQAQQDLTQARRDAKAELQDLTNRLASAQLSERDAALSVQEAQTRLRAVQAKGSKASLLEQQRAQLAYDQAVQRLREQRLETGRLGAEKARTDRSGVDGTERVKSAQERLVSAQRGVASQEAALAKARADVGRAQIQNSRDIATAQARVATAQRNLGKAQEDGARSVARARQQVSLAEQQAAQSVARAQQQLVAARQSAADSIASAERQVKSAQLSSAGGANTAAAAQAKYQAALAKMTPAARGTFNAFLRLRTAFTAWSRSLQPAVMPIFTRALNGMRKSLPGLTPFVLAAARAITTLQERVSRGFKSPWWQSFKRDLSGAVEPAIVGLGVSFGRIFKGMGGIVQAFLPHMDRISAKMQQVTGRFANWGTGLKGSPEFERFLDYSARMGPQVAETIGKIGNAFWQISRALEPLSGPLLVVLGLLADGIANLAQAFPGLIQLFWLALVASRLYRLSLIAAAVAMGVFRAAVVLAILATRGWTAAVIAANLAFAANPVVAVIMIIIAAIGLLIAGIIYAWRNWSWFRTAVLAVWAGIRAAALWAWHAVLKPIFSAIWVGMQAVGRAGLWLWQNALLPAWRGIAFMISLYWNFYIKPIFFLIRWYFRLLASAAMWLWRNGIAPAFRGIAAAGRWLWDTVLKPYFSAIWAGLRAVGAAAVWLWKKAILPAFRGIWTVGKWLAIAIAVMVVGPIVIAFRVLAAAARWAWRNVIAPAFRGIAAAGRWLWQKVLKPTFAATRVGLRLLGNAFRWLYRNVIAPAMRGIAAVVRWLWSKVMRPIWNTTKSGLRLLAAAFRWLRDKVVRPVWSGIRWVISNAWKYGMKPAFSAIRTGVWLVATAFRKAKDAMGKAWDGIREKTRKPIKWVIDKVYNYGVRELWNNARKVLPGLKYLKWQKFATGGAVNGPGTATSDSIPARLSRGEHVWTAKEVQGAGGHAGVQALRSAAAGGAYAKGGPAVAPSGVPGFAKGGIVDWIEKGGNFVNRVNSKITGGAVKVADATFGRQIRRIRDSALGGVSKIAGLAAKPLRALLDKIPGGKSGWGQMATAAPKGILDAVLSAIQSSEDGAMGGGSPGVARALKWVKTQAGKPYQWGGGGNPSFDCSGLMSSIGKVIQGKNPRGRLWSTHAFSGKTAPSGWKYHLPSPFRIGVTNAGVGHTAGTLAGTKVESRGGDGVVVGKRARGYNSPMFGSSWYGFKPAIGGGGGFSAKAVGAAQSAAKQMLGEYGWGQDQFGPLKKLWQKESGWRWNARNASSGAYGIPQCVDLETRILTKRGWLGHDEVRIGDETLGYNLDGEGSEWTRISDIHHYPQADMVTIEGDRGWQARCTPGHRWILVGDYGRSEFVTAEELRPGMRLRTADTGTVEVIAVRRRNSEDVWCVTTGLGTWTAGQDGQVFLTGNSLPASKMRSAGADWRTNPATQIKWGLKYIKGRYGSPAGAWAHSQRVNWYDGGGYLPEGLSTVYNGTGAPEPVLTGQQMKALQGAAVRGSDGASAGGLQPGDALTLVVDGHEFHGYVDARAGGVVKASQSRATTRFRAGRG